ncbi:MAG: translesion error-prone DNA polymerase V autoproteolytic subunit [Leptolyngbyaceae bacterium]|nr:translesion error-prone DNA polymerase V autoproteolytic subunit [Leptolyngbyaceae bacterium]
MPRGGARAGAGRPKGTGKYGEKTVTVRIPASMGDAVKEFVESEGNLIPLYSNSVSAGAPCFAEDDLEDRIDLGKYLVRNPATSFLVRASGYSMINAGIHPGDMLLADSSLEPRNGKIVIAAVDGHLTVKTLHKSKSETILMPENDEYEPIPLNSDNDVTICGVVTMVFHPV